MKPLRIALIGQMRSGKDTVAEYLVENHGFNRLAFGDKLKQFAHEIFMDAPYEPKPRSLYQFMNIMRDYDEDVWVKHLEVDYLENKLYEENVVITDVRQENELEWCLEQNYKIIRVFSRLENRVDRMESSGEKAEEELLQHATENKLDSIEPHYTIINNGTIDDLNIRIDEVVKKIREEMK